MLLHFFHELLTRDHGAGTCKTFILERLLVLASPLRSPTTQEPGPLREAP